MPKSCLKRLNQHGLICGSGVKNRRPKSPLQGAKPLEASEAASPLAKTLAVATEGAKPLEASAAAKPLAVLRKLESEVGPV